MQRVFSFEAPPPPEMRRNVSRRGFGIPDERAADGKDAGTDGSGPWNVRAARPNIDLDRPSARATRRRGATASVGSALPPSPEGARQTVDEAIALAAPVYNRQKGAVASDALVSEAAQLFVDSALKIYDHGSSSPSNPDDGAALVPALAAIVEGMPPVAPRETLGMIATAVQTASLVFAGEKDARELECSSATASGSMAVAGVGEGATAFMSTMAAVGVADAISLLVENRHAIIHGLLNDDDSGDSTAEGRGKLSAAGRAGMRHILAAIRDAEDDAEESFAPTSSRRVSEIVADVVIADPEGGATFVRGMTVSQFEKVRTDVVPETFEAFSRAVQESSSSPSSDGNGARGQQATKVIASAIADPVVDRSWASLLTEPQLVAFRDHAPQAWRKLGGWEAAAPPDPAPLRGARDAPSSSFSTPPPPPPHPFLDPIMGTSRLQRASHKAVKDFVNAHGGHGDPEIREALSRAGISVATGDRPSSSFAQDFEMEFDFEKEFEKESEKNFDSEKNHDFGKEFEKDYEEAAAVPKPHDFLEPAEERKMRAFVWASTAGGGLDHALAGMGADSVTAPLALFVLYVAVRYGHPGVRLLDRGFYMGDFQRRVARARVS